jgi:hypothetical protein
MTEAFGDEPEHDDGVRCREDVSDGIIHAGLVTATID